MFGMCIVGGSMLHGSRDTLVLCSVVADLLARERIFVQPSTRALTTRFMRNNCLHVNLGEQWTKARVINALWKL